MKDTKVDMKPVFFDALAKNSVIPEQEISVESLGRCYGPLQKQVLNNIYYVKLYVNIAHNTLISGKQHDHPPRKCNERSPREP